MNPKRIPMKNTKNNSFYDKIYAAVCLIPRGRVATYGQVAALAGNGGAARAVGNALHKNPMPGVIPCHRVVNAQGRLAPHFAFGGASGWTEGTSTSGCISGAISEICIFRQTVV